MLTWVLIIGSILGLVVFADVFVDQVSSLANKFKVSEFAIGFTVVAFGTSMPELVSTVFGVWSGHQQLVVSSIIGSNITNLCLVLGLVAVFNKFKIQKRDVKINFPINLLGLAAFWLVTTLTGFSISWKAGILLMLFFLSLQLISGDFNHLRKSRAKYVPLNIFLLFGSFILLILSGKICVEQIVGMAQKMQISESIVGYFLLAMGTSIPELVTTWTAVRKNEGEMGIGNILGSNMFNLLFIFGASSGIKQLEISEHILGLGFLTGVTVLAYLMVARGKNYTFNRNKGIVLLLMYFLFVGLEVIVKRIR